MNTQPTAPGPVIGLTRPEIQRASLANLVDAHVRNDKAELGFFRSISDAVTKATGQQTTGPTSYLIPGDSLGGVQKRDMLASSAPGGGYLVGLELSGFSDALRNRSIVGTLPVTRLRNLTSDVTITPLSANSSTAWLASEGVTQAGSTQGSFGQVAMTPKPIAATVTLSHQFMRQLGPGARAFVDNGLAGALAEAVDLGFMQGSGNSGQPSGILTISGTDTRAGTSFALADACAMLKVCDGRKYGDSIRWVCGVNTAELLRKREAAAGSGLLLVNNTMLGYPVVVSRSAGANTLAIAEWSTVNFGEWGSLEVGIDVMSLFTTGRAILRALWRVDVAVERPGQVAVATAIT